MKIEPILKFVPKISTDTSLLHVAHVMAKYRLRALPVVQDNTIIGKIDVRVIVNDNLWGFPKLIFAKETKSDTPVYIVGLPDDPFEAEAAKIKFTRLINSLSKFIPQILEARSIIKSSSSGGQREHYKINVFIKTAKDNFIYSSSG